VMCLPSVGTGGLIGLGNTTVWCYIDCLCVYIRSCFFLLFIFSILTSAFSLRIGPLRFEIGCCKRRVIRDVGYNLILFYFIVFLCSLICSFNGSIFSFVLAYMYVFLWFFLLALILIFTA